MEALAILLSAAVALSAEALQADTDVVVATMTANGTQVPGGYVMPAGGHITFTCRHNGTSPEVIFWAIDVVNSTISKQDTAAIHLRGTPGLSTSVKSVTDNPVSVTISNLQLANNGSTVKCEVKREGSPAVILVEGVPSCPVVDISSDPDSSLTVSMRAGHQRWLLPVWFQVVVSSANRLTRSFSTTANMTTIPPCQANDVHNISIHPCNAVGCNKGCPAYPINKTTSEGLVHGETSTLTMTGNTKSVTVTERGSIIMYQYASSCSPDSDVVASLIAINVFLFVILLALIAVIIALAKRLHAKHRQCTCKLDAGVGNRIGEEERGNIDDGAGGIDGVEDLSVDTISQIEQVKLPAELNEDIDSTYISIEPSKVL